MRMNLREAVNRRNLPDGGTVCEIGIGEEYNGRHVLKRNLGSHKRIIEAVSGCRSSHNDSGALAIASVDSLQKIRLLGLGRQTGRRTATLNIDYYKRQLSHYSQTDRFALEREAGSGGGGTSKVTSKGSTQSGAHAGDLIFSLHGHHTAVFALREFVEDIGSRGDGIGAEEELLTSALSRSDKAPSSGFVTGNRGMTSARVTRLLSSLNANLIHRERERDSDHSCNHRSTLLRSEQ